MVDAIRSWVRRGSLETPVYVVSGLPRSGTSMMMRMLEAGGITPFTDGERVADIDNPTGYYEFERVKDLENDPDRSWVRKARGHALKVISFLLRHLPDENDYRIIYMRRDLDEVLESQNQMLDRLGTAAPGTDLEAMKEAYRNDIIGARLYARKQPFMEMIEVHYAETVSNPLGTARLVNRFLRGDLDEAAMAAVVDGELYRKRA